MSSTAGTDDYTQFKAWMAEFQLGPGDDMLRQRWAAIAKLVKELTVDDLETLVRLALKWRQPPATASVDRIVAHFAEDSTFSAAGSTRELQVLAAVGLARVASTQGHKHAPTAALMIATGLFGGPRKVDLPLDLAVLGEAALNALSTGVGRRPTLAAPRGIARFNFDAASTAVGQQNWAQVAVDLKASGAAADAAVSLLATQFFAVTRVFEQTLRQQDEELQMLWWLLGGRSELLDMPFDSMSGDGQALVLGAELAAHTVLPPGPPSVATLLGRAGLKSRGKVEVAKAISACDHRWLSTLVDGEALSPVIFPMHFGIQRQLETGTGNDWVANWAAVTGLKADWALPPVALGKFFYRECLLLQAV